MESSIVNDGNDSDRNDEITVGALFQSRTFADVADLGAFVQEVLDHRGGIFDPFEIAAISKLAALANGQALGEVARIARATAFHVPSRTKIPTPFDRKLDKLLERLEATEVAWLEARRQHDDAVLAGRRSIAEARAKAGTRDQTAHWVEQASRAAQQRLGQSSEAVRIAREEHERALAGRNALELAADRWRYDQDLRYHNADDPSKPLTRAELEERFAAE